MVEDGRMADELQHTEEDKLAPAPSVLDSVASDPPELTPGMAFSHHMRTCRTCQSNPMAFCEEGIRLLRAAISREDAVTNTGG